jgi:hypothetical protein
MTKLTKQQIILLSVMLLFIVGAIFYFLVPNKARKTVEDTGQKLAELKAFVSTVNASLAKEAGGADSRVIGLAEAGWSGNPFYDKKSYKDWAVAKGLAKATEEPSQKLNIRYTGYVEAGKEKIAIINGTEFSVGDTIGLDGYVLKEILPTKVVVQSRTNKAKIEVPVQE